MEFTEEEEKNLAAAGMMNHERRIRELEKLMEEHKHSLPGWLTRDPTGKMISKKKT